MENLPSVDDAVRRPRGEWGSPRISACNVWYLQRSYVSEEKNATNGRSQSWIETPILGRSYRAPE